MMDILATPQQSPAQPAQQPTPPQLQQAGEVPAYQKGYVNGHVLRIKDVAQLVRFQLVSVPSGFTTSGLPILYVPLSKKPGLDFAQILDEDLHLLFKYFLSVVPRTEQGPGFAIIIDRRGEEWTVTRQTLHKIAIVFPARIREVYLLTNNPHADPNLAKLTRQLVEEFLLDFNLITLSDPSELQHYVDAKCLPQELGGQVHVDVEGWISLQEHVESFSYNARCIARKLAQFVGILNNEETNALTCSPNSMREVANKNRRNYRTLRKELEELTDHGLLMLKNLQRPDSNVMQRLAVQILCKQLDQAWTYFNRSWKIQDHLYVQHVELNAFQKRFRETTYAFGQLEHSLQEVPVQGSSVEELNVALDKLDSAAQDLHIHSKKAKDLIKVGQDLLSSHTFTADCVQPKIRELKVTSQRLELLVVEKRRLLHKFLDLLECLDAISKWCLTASDHLDRLGNGSAIMLENIFSQIRQVDYLLSKSRELKVRSRSDFEDLFDDIKEVMSAQTLFAVDDSLSHLESIIHRVMQTREELRSKATRTERKQSYANDLPSSMTDSAYGGSSVTTQQDPSEAMKVKRENILDELLKTEMRYVEDLESVLTHYRNALSSTTSLNDKCKAVFANLDEIHDFHANCLYPELEKCGVNPASVARAFISQCQEIRLLYSHYCQNMDMSRAAIEELGGEQNPNSILVQCQKNAGHQLPLSSYLLKPMQRLTKYQLLLKDLTESSNVVCGKAELEEALSELLSVIKVVNDSMHGLNIKGLPNAIKPLGALNSHEVFQVVKSEAKSQGQLLFRNRSQRRHVFLYDNHLVVTKAISEKSQIFQFKFSLSTAGLGMSSVVKGDEKKIELWAHGRGNDIFVLEAKAKKAKDEFAAELRKVIIRQKERRGNNMGSFPSTSRLLHHQQGQGQIFYDTISSSSSSSHGRMLKRAALMMEDGKDGHGKMLTRSRSLESGRAANTVRSRSLDYAERQGRAGRSSSPEDDPDKAMPGDCFVVLADYIALTGREIDLSEDEVVELVKIGCAGWWYVRVTEYPFPEGWAPSTYLEKIT